MNSEFAFILRRHRQLSARWAKGEDKAVSASAIQSFVDSLLPSSANITSIEDREEIRYILRLWASRLTTLDQPYPDIDIDEGEYRPSELTTRPCPSDREIAERSQYTQDAHALLRVYSADYIGEVMRFVETLKAAGVALYAPLSGLLHAILETARVFADSKRGRYIARFILIEARDTEEPFFGFAQSMYNYGFTLLYHSERQAVEKEIDKLRERLRVDHATVLPDEVESRVVFEKLPRCPRATNLCFLERVGEPVPVGFWTIRAHKRTIGGWSMTEEDAETELKDLKDLLQRTLKLKKRA